LSDLNIDPAGNVFGIESYHRMQEDYDDIFEIVKGSGTITSNAGGAANDLISDSAGNLFVAYYGMLDGMTVDPGLIYEMPAGSSAETTLYQFADLEQPNAPEAALVSDSNGNFFGTTSAGGIQDPATGFTGGTVIEIARGSTAVTTLADIPVGVSIDHSPVAVDGAGDVFGTDSVGVYTISEEIYEVAAGSHTFSTLYTPANTLLTGGLAIDSKGNLFGTMIGNGSVGSVFMLAKGSKAPVTVASFDVFDGENPNAVTLDAAGDIFGTTSGGGTSGYGTVFEVAAKSHAITTLANFNGDQGFVSSGPVTLDAAGDLFGVVGPTDTFAGTAIYEVVKGSGSVTTLATFDDGSRLDPPPTNAPLAVDAEGNVFAAGGDPDPQESQMSDILEIPKGTRQIDTLFTFDDPSSDPTGITVDAAGNLFGMTSSGGTANAGTFFELKPTPGLQPAGTLEAEVDQGDFSGPPSIIVPYIDSSNYINLSSIAGSNLTVTSPDGTPLNVTLDSTSGLGEVVEATYSVTPVDGSWSAADDGPYTLSLANNAVMDDAGVGVMGGTSSFEVNIPSGADSFPATISAPDINSAAVAPEAITVVFSDPIAIYPQTIDSNAISVTDPGGNPLSVSLASMSTTADGVTAVYTVDPPAGGWTSAANGAYDIALKAGYVQDYARVYADGETGSFNVNVPAAVPVTVQASPPLVNDSALVPSVSASLPMRALIAGTTIPAIREMLHISNTGSTSMSGPVTVSLLLSSDSTGQSNGTIALAVRRRIKLKAGKAANVPISLHKLPADVSGSVYLLTEITDSTGKTSFTASASPMTVESPYIDLTGVFVKSPATARPGKDATLTLAIANGGNIAVKAPLTLTLQLSDTSITPATDITIGNITHRISIRPHGQTRLRLSVPIPTTGGPFHVTALLNSNGGIPESNMANDAVVSPLIKLG
jgi:uncharacterized repeat protein (TIGR03803 family)